MENSVHSALIATATSFLAFSFGAFAAQSVTPASRQREFVAEHRFLHLPIKNGAPTRRVTLLVDGAAIERDDVELADGEPDWWAPIDIAAWHGKSVVVRVDGVPARSGALDAIEQSDSMRGSHELYHEPLRGQFHFSPRRGWNNDPNGLVYFDGEYHLFFQHNPFGWSWGNMHWGHATSRDLVHWREHGDVLAPDDSGAMFSGSAVVDRDNTSGLGAEGRAPLVLVYTADGNPSTQCIAWSVDGRRFAKHAGNPVVKQITPHNRDPKVIWHEPTHRWVMALYVELEGGKRSVHLLTSPNLREWTLASVVDGIDGSNYLYECPDFFELALDGDQAKRKWILRGANGEYAIGAFDGTRFTPEQARVPGHQGVGCYAPQTFSDVPASDGRRIQIAWFQTPTPGMPFNQSMTLPVALRLVSTDDGPRLTYAPVRELDSLRVASHAFERGTIEPGGPNPLASIEAELVELRTTIEPAPQSEVTFRVRGATIVYDAAAQELVVNGHRAKSPLRNGKQRLIVYCDRTGLEVFASDGLTYVPMPYQPSADDRSLSLSVTGGPLVLTELQVYELASAWTDR